MKSIIMILKNFKLTFFSILCLIIFITSTIQAAEYYADIQINVDTAGYVTIEGKSNYPDLIIENTENYTSKTQSLWTLNISINKIFSDFVYSIRLPENTMINSLKSSGSTLIGEESGNLIINGFGTNKPLSIIVTYQIEKFDESIEPLGLDLFSILLIGIIIVLTFILLLVLFFMDKKRISLEKQHNVEISQKNLKGLNERQKQILKLLQESQSALTQTEIQRHLHLPKASVSRNIRRLELKGLIEKEHIGMSNLIRLKKP